jgi:hypothetical protein
MIHSRNSFLSVVQDGFSHIYIYTYSCINNIYIHTYAYPYVSISCIYMYIYIHIYIPMIIHSRNSFLSVVHDGSSLVLTRDRRLWSPEVLNKPVYEIFMYIMNIYICIYMYMFIQCFVLTRDRRLWSPEVLNKPILRGKDYD